MVISPDIITGSKDSSKVLWDLLSQIPDPEIPVLSVVDLGIVRDIIIHADHLIEIIITPTYSGCPAMDAITMNIRLAMIANGYKNFKITSRLSPAWTTDWMTDDGKNNLKAYGIAPPVGKSYDFESLNSLEIKCPQCNSSNTKLLSEFGSTSCKALFQCNDCKEPFDYFKCH
ncbi:MAG: 1,2-phenylacetyl-CoA epoxidase subunit PaaD [Chitinophagaceae bacterium]